MNPSCNRKSRNGTPHLKRGAPVLYPNKKQVSAPCGTAGVGGLASREGFAEITSGRSHFAAGLETTCKDFSNEGRTRSREEGDGIGA